MLDWELYRVHGQGSQSPYQYVTVDVYKDFSSSLKGINREIVQEVLGDKTDQVADEIMASRELTYRETLEFSMGLPTRGDDKYLLHYAGVPFFQPAMLHSKLLGIMVTALTGNCILVIFNDWLMTG